MAAEVILPALLRLAVGLLVVSVPLSSNGEDGLGSSVVVTILSQSDEGYHATRAEEKREEWLEELSTADNNQTPVLLLAHQLPVKGKTWTVVPLLPHLAENYPEASWFFFANEETEVDFRQLLTLLEHFNENQVWFLGHALKDQKLTIIHHYMDHTSAESISYPNFASGWLLSGPALKRAAGNAELFAPNFHIDPQFELAVFLKYMRTPELQEFISSIPPAGEGGGYLLTHVAELCMEPALTPGCATAYSHHLPSCGEIKVNELFIGVKTCEKYHSTRLPVVHGTWARDAEGSIAYYSEVEDKQFLTTDIGVPNTESGHCGKMMAIIRKFQTTTELRDREWLVIADDDTLLSVPRLCRLLACYSPAQPILLGEVYGYIAARPSGYSYVTGGGGMVLSRGAVEMITGRGVRCPQDNTPDDMFLGRVAEDLGIHIIHSPLFHQAQPDTFHPSILALQTPVSFHRHRPADPYTVYQHYLNQSSTETGTNADTMTSRANAASNAVMQATVEPPNTGHVGDEHFVHCLEVVPSSEEYILILRMMLGVKRALARET